MVIEETAPRFAEGTDEFGTTRRAGPVPQYGVDSSRHLEGVCKLLDLGFYRKDIRRLPEQEALNLRTIICAAIWHVLR